ncbi:hypothetical protein B0H17DRAFT_1175312 [Mycena rosella]|uniref:Uncharacterized protein n=1 Tax=Mycena rosella TaxID=1033263 RepID=A0AAD7GUN7_MYCRO|nr:hypothetical protein B0H17DRAFT_1175312 [Mycena rosella]
MMIGIRDETQVRSRQRSFWIRGVRIELDHMPSACSGFLEEILAGPDLLPLGAVRFFAYDSTLMFNRSSLSELDEEQWSSFYAHRLSRTSPSILGEIDPSTRILPTPGPTPTGQFVTRPFSGASISAVGRQTQFQSLPLEPHQDAVLGALLALPQCAARPHALDLGRRRSLFTYASHICDATTLHGQLVCLIGQLGFVRTRDLSGISRLLRSTHPTPTLLGDTFGARSAEESCKKFTYLVGLGAVSCCITEVSERSLAGGAQYRPWIAERVRA